MDFRRIPFNFTTSDPLKRQEELQKRFGLPVKKSNMFVDFANPADVMGTKPDMGASPSSPRLQHRVPIFVEGQSEPTKPSVDAQNVDSGRKPHVRVIPIEIEGEDNTTKRHHFFSGSSKPVKERVSDVPITVETVKPPVPQSPKAPRICNIPIKIEGGDPVLQPKSSVKTQEIKNPVLPKHKDIIQNGCSASKVAKISEQKESVREKEKKESPEQVILKKIQNVEEKLKGYHEEVEKFSGTNKEKQYRYLDEMLTRCMLELDEIDTMGLDTIRLARKAAVKKVQASVDLLESKIIKEEIKQELVINEPMNVESADDQTLENHGSANMKFVGVNTGDTGLAEASLKDQVNGETKIAVDKMIETLPEQICEKVEHFSPMDTVMKSGENVDGEVNKSAVEMDLDCSDCEKGLKKSDVSSIELCTDVKEVKEEISEPSQSLEMEVTETSDIPITENTVLSNLNSTIAQQSATICSNNDC